MNYKIITAGILLVLFQNCYPQSIDINDIISGITNDLNPEDADDQNLDQLIQSLYYYYENPLYINEASSEQLSSLGILSPFQIHSLMEHRKKYGYFLSIYEIPTVFGFNVETAKQIQPFVRFDKSPQKAYQKREIRGLFLARTGKKYTSYQSLNSFNNLADWKLYSKLNLNINNKIGFNVTAENDPGELMFNDTLPKGPDFTSFSLSFKEVGIINNVVIGDYNININQGLMIWTGYGGYKGSNALNIAKSDHAISKYTSTNEQNFLRGCAIHMENNLFGTVIYYSNKNIDASLIKDDTLSNDSYFSSIYNTGTHSSSADLNKKNQVNEQIIGGGLTLNTKNLQLNLSGNILHYNYPFRYRDQFHLVNATNSSNYTSMSFGYKYQLNKLSIFGEEVFQITTGKLAGINGIMLLLSEELSSVIVYRNYPSGYSNYYAKGFAEYSGTSNEKGVYIACRFQPTSEWEVTGFSDLFSNPWARYNLSAPLNGQEYGLKIAFGNYDYTIYGQYKFTGKYTNIPLESENTSHTRQFIYKEQQSIRFHMKFKLNDQVINQTRLQLKNYFGNDAFPGYLIFNSISYSPIDKSTLSVRYTWYNSKDFNSRIYTYERDVLYSMSIPAFFGRGYKITLNAKLRISNQFNFWVKYGFQKEYEPMISYKERYNKHELKFQIGYRF